MGIKSNNSAASFFDFFSRSGIDAVLPEPLPVVPLYAEDLFSTYLYDGTGAAQTITNGIDLSGDGGLVWFKNRETAYAHALFDTERGVNKTLRTNGATTELTYTDMLTAFNSNGFTLGADANTEQVNKSGQKVCSWTFRKAPGFFDIVTYTSQSGVTSINHNLGSVPGCIMVKNLTQGTSWQVYHRSLGAGKELELDGTAGERTTNAFPSTPTSTHFSINAANNAVFGNVGDQFVAYIFAHNDASFGENEDQSIINCGSFTSGSFTTNVNINLGWEPQFFLVKKTSNTGDWWMIDTMRGFCSDAGNGPQNRVLRSNASNGEGAEEYWRPTATGIEGFPSGGSETYIYMAIRSPFKPPESGTDVFSPSTQVGTVPNFSAPWPVDLSIRLLTAGGNTTYSQMAVARLTGEKYMATSQGNAEASPSGFSIAWDHNDGWGDLGGTGTGLSFKCAPGFLDVVTYTGTGSNRSVNHNLGVVPEMMIVKKRNGAANWQVYHSSQGNTKYSPSFRTDPFYTSSARWNNTSPTSTQFTLGTDNDVNGSSSYVAYLFATLPGISKVGSYSGTGSSQDINCGFTNGARFVLIKRADSEVQGTAPDRTNWYVWDSSRGIVSGNDPWIALNETDAQVTNTDYIDPLSTGFTVTSTGAGLNASGGTYIFLAIA